MSISSIEGSVLKLWHKVAVATGLTVATATALVLQLFNIPSHEVTDVHSWAVAAFGLLTAVFGHHLLSALTVKTVVVTPTPTPTPVPAPAAVVVSPVAVTPVI